MYLHLLKHKNLQSFNQLLRAIEILGSLANVAPVFDYVNFDNLVKHLADIVGVPQKIFKTTIIKFNAERQQQATCKNNKCNKCNRLQQVAKAGGDIAPLAKALPEEARAVANADVE